MKVVHAGGAYEVVQQSLAVTLQDLEDAFIVTDKNVAHHWLSRPSVPFIAIQPGEPSKSVATYLEVLDFLVGSGASRSSTVVALGGGVVGDLAGFVAATYMRGVRFLQVPTSLLAMVDSSVGGKVGINLPQGKNLVGAFYAPVKVAICLECLETLPERDFRSGTAEIWKAAAALDRTLFEDLERSPLTRDDTRLAEVVMHCVDIKRAVVERDEFEATGERAVLNFGHTVGHAIEQVLGFGTLLHGEAISIGMIVEARIGERLGHTPEGMSARLAKGLESQGLPAKLPHLQIPAMLAAMRVDKKSGLLGTSLALLTGCGSCKLVPGVPESLVLECLQENL